MYTHPLMSDFLQWYNLIFYLPLGFGILISLGAGFTGLEHDAGHDVDSDLDGRESFFSILGFGKVPLAIVLASLFLVFGEAGICFNFILHWAIPSWQGFAVVSVLGASIATFFGTAFISRLLVKYLPTTETDSVSKQDLVGCPGTITVACDESSGYAHITNARGDLYQIGCRSVEPLPRGTKILTIDYNESSDTFRVDVDPTSTMD